MLKWIAVISMVIDHIAYYFFDQIPQGLYEFMRSIGRLAMPIFAFSLAFGFIHSKNWFKYFIRLLITALISELAIRYTYQLLGFVHFNLNIIFTFILSLVFLIALKILLNSGYDLLVRMQPISSTGLPDEHLPYQFRVSLGGIELSPVSGLILGLAFMMISIFCALYFDVEYGLYGILMVIAFYLVLEYKHEKPLYWAFGLVFTVNLIFQVGQWLSLGEPFDFNPTQWLTLLAVPICFSPGINNKPQKAWQKYFFYAFYPCHLVLLALLRYWLVG